MSCTSETPISEETAMSRTSVGLQVVLGQYAAASGLTQKTGQWFQTWGMLFLRPHSCNMPCFTVCCTQLGKAQLGTFCFQLKDIPHGNIISHI